MFDSHIHLDQFSDAEIYAMLQTAELNGVLGGCHQFGKLRAIAETQTPMPQSTHFRRFPPRTTTAFHNRTERVI